MPTDLVVIMSISTKHNVGTIEFTEKYWRWRISSDLRMTYKHESDEAKYWANIYADFIENDYK
jgi:hypothetical protein